MEYLDIPYAPSARPWFEQIANAPGAIWFHSGQPGRPAHRWEWCSAWPGERYQYLGAGRVRCRHPEGETEYRVEDFFRFLDERRRTSDITDLPFASGLAGHLDYDAGHELQGLASRHGHAQALASVDRYDWSLVLDHRERRGRILIHPDCPAEVRARVRALATEQPQGKTPESTSPRLAWHSLMDRDTYLNRFARLHDYILAGDIYQANLTRQWHAHLAPDTDDWSLYSALIDQVPAPYSVYHRAPDHSLFSVSPERFLIQEGDRILTQPIKGTRPRGGDPAEDEALARELSASEKDRAENLMIVDLLRNDLSRNAEPGSVQVPVLFELQSFSNVHHLVSTITARRPAQTSPLAVLRDAFPGGSITGAPKRRAMQIIDELEVAARGSYCGSAFWLSDAGYLDSNILIRSMIRRDDDLLCAAGGGIVADSQGEDEYEESATKVRQLLSALGEIKK